MNPVLQELLTQYQQKQISFDEFKLDLQGLCKMSPGMVPAARLLIERAMAQGAIAEKAGGQLIQSLAKESPDKTLLRRDMPSPPTSSANDATVLMGNRSNQTQVPDKTVALGKPEMTLASDPTVLMNNPATSVANEPTVLTSRAPITPPDVTSVMREPLKGGNSVSESTVAISRQPVEKTHEATRVMEPPTAHREIQTLATSSPEKTQRIAPSQPASNLTEKTQRLPPGGATPAPLAPEKTQRIDFSSPAAVEKTQRIHASGASPQTVGGDASSDAGLGTGLDFDLSATPDKTQPMTSSGSTGAQTGGTKPADSLMGTMERFLTDGPLPQGLDMGFVQFGPGTIIKERFLLKEQIGSGGMGVVYSAIDRRKTEARDPNPLVAIKILGSDFARHPKSLIALQREARKAQELAHPNVATVYDFDREGDAVYMTMELLNGRSLDGLTREIRGKGLSRDEAWPIIRGIAEGLAYAHRKGLVHSDLKPANVFLVEDNIPKLLDFGIARAVPSRLSKQTVKDIFDAGSLGAYTVPYATPEMVEGGEPHPADDIYALGLMAYELLAGAHPYKRKGAVEASGLGMKPVPIKGLPRREWKTIERAVSFKREDRPQDADAFLKALRGVTKLQKSLIAATAVLATTAGYFAYSSYQEAGPEIPFAQLPSQTQLQFNAYMSDGDKLWSFYVKDKNILALQEAVEQYASAYDLHPRNRDAVKALKKVADATLDATKDNPEQQREFAKSLIARSTFLAKDYPPLHQFVE